MMKAYACGLATNEAEKDAMDQAGYDYKWVHLSSPAIKTVLSVLVMFSCPIIWVYPELDSI